MKLDSIIRKYGREVMNCLKDSNDEESVRHILEAQGHRVGDDEVKDILSLLNMLNGGLRELSLDELSQITGS
ncbi:MAG: hypothetical protein ACI37N_00945 [Prevotella sp.]